MAKPGILLSSVFKPFGVDNMYSRRDSKIELFHNQLTKYQDVFSMRTFMSLARAFCVGSRQTSSVTST